MYESEENQSETPAGDVPSRPAGPRDLSLVPIEGLEDEICTMAGHLAAATCTWLELIAEFDRRNGWAGPGLRSCAQWLSWRVGLSPIAGREHVRVARALTMLPRMRAEFATGRLSYSKVRALTRIATPELEESLIDIALTTTATQVERVVGGYRRANRLEPRPSGRPARSVTTHWDEVGSLVIRARLTAEEGALYLAAIDAMRHDLAKTHRDAADPDAETPADTAAGGPGAGPGAGQETAHECTVATLGYDEQAEAHRSTAADAFVAMATSALANGPVDGSGADRFQVVVHADLDQLNLQTSESDHPRADQPAAPKPSGNRSLRRGRCHLRNGPCIHPETLHRIACDAVLRVVIHGPDGTPLDQGRSKRLVDPKLRRALEERDDRRCRFIGCDATRHLHAHHIKHWSRGGRTDLANLILLCGFHHRLLHEHGYQIEVPAPNSFRFLRPDGSTIEESPPTRGDPWLDQLTAPLHTPPMITPATTTPGWAGEHLDLGYIVSLLFSPDQSETAA